MDRKKLFIVIGAILLGLFLFFYFANDKSKKHFSWRENYRIDNKQPYGAYVIHELIKAAFDNRFSLLESSVANNLSGDIENSLYVLIGSDAYYQYTDIDSLMSFVAAGNSALIATKSWPHDITYELLTNDCGNVRLLDTEKVSMGLNRSPGDDYSYEYINNQKSQKYTWSYIDSLTCPNELQPIGYLNGDKPNYFRVNHGEGTFYFHMSPLVFTNYYLKEERALEYAEALMSEISSGHLYWDEYSKLPFKEAKSDNSPLKYILSQPALQWAWYLLLATVVIYFIFYSKRRQRIIPVMEGNHNTTIEFAETMGYLYFEEQSHKKIADHKWHLFLGYIRKHYYLRTHIIDDELIKKVSLKSKVPHEQVQEIFKEYQRLDFKVDIDAKDLIKFHELIEGFYGSSN